MAADKTKHDLPRAVWALGLTALFMDTSSELIHGLLPVFLVVTLGASAIALGAIEGIAEATAQITRVFSGWLSDALGKRKALTVAGYGLAAVTKPLFPLADRSGSCSSPSCSPGKGRRATLEVRDLLALYRGQPGRGPQCRLKRYLSVR